METQTTAAAMLPILIFANVCLNCLAQMGHKLARVACMSVVTRSEKRFPAWSNFFIFFYKMRPAHNLVWLPAKNNSNYK